MSNNDMDDKIAEAVAVALASYRGGAVDPTANVISLVNAAIKRLDDLRLAEEKRVTQIMELRADHARELSVAEAKRIDAIRAVDVAAVSVASERATAQASVLANQVSTSAETLRVLVAATATTVANQLTSALSPITERLSLLEKNQYQVQGGAAVSSPISAAIADRISLLEKSQNTIAGSGRGKADLFGWVVAFIVTVLAITSFVIPRIK